MFTPEEKQLLEKYVTSAEDDVFAVKGMPGMVGAAYARYSRARGGFREVLLNEFLKEGAIDPKHADLLIERVLIAYGDDSVGELEGAHISFENISMLATKEIEERRIGGSPIEQSTRYVFYDQKTREGNWRYLRSPELLDGERGRSYEKGMDEIFSIYSGLIEPMKKYFEHLKPIEQAEYDINGDGAKERLSDLSSEKDRKAFQLTYTVDLRTKACDTLRCLLPLSTLTNLGVYGNGRFFQSLISHLWSSDIPEAYHIGDKAFAATSNIIRQYVRRAKKSEYTIHNRITMRKLAKTVLTHNQDPFHFDFPYVNLLDSSNDFVDGLLASMLYTYAESPFETILSAIQKMDAGEKSKIIASYTGTRHTRRDRPGRAYEFGYPLNFEMVTNWGVYKDLMRHRMNTQLRQLFTTKLGFDLPHELSDAGFTQQAEKCQTISDELFDKFVSDSPVLAQYCVLHGHGIRWLIGMNFREAFHMLELRTTPQGHAQYRLAAQAMHKAIEKRYPELAQQMNFVDHNEYFWARGDSEAKQRVKEKKLEEKIS